MARGAGGAQTATPRGERGLHRAADQAAERAAFHPGPFRQGTGERRRAVRHDARAHPPDRGAGADEAADCGEAGDHRRVRRLARRVPAGEGTGLSRRVVQDLQGHLQVPDQRRALRSMGQGLLHERRGPHHPGRARPAAGSRAGLDPRPHPRRAQRPPLRQRHGGTADDGTGAFFQRAPGPVRAQPRRGAPAYRQGHDPDEIARLSRLCESCAAGLAVDEEDQMTEKRIGIIMHGVTGRMGMNQHLIRSILEIRKQGGVALKDGTRVMPDPLLVGRNAVKVEELARKHGVERWTADLDAALNSQDDSVFFDAASTQLRPKLLKRAIAAGKHVYCEKPVSMTLAEAKDLYSAAKKGRVKHGVVQDKLWLPGLLKLKKLLEEDFFGRVFAVRGEFGYWVFEGDRVPAQRPSWNYRKQDGGGIILDMLCHWRYVLDNLFGEVKAVSCLGATHIPQRWDENGKQYKATADDAAYATFLLKGNIVAQFNSSWDVRVRRDDLLTLQVDGTKGSAVAGLRNCLVQAYEKTPKPVWNPDIPQPINFFHGWEEVPDENYDNAFKVQWELFLKHVAGEGAFRWNLLEGAKGVQLAELGLKSWKQKKWLDVPRLKS